jgi:hypothetical protein
VAVFRPPILGFGTVPDSSGSVFLEPSSIKLTNDLYPRLVWVFNDTATKISLYGAFPVPHNYVSAAALVLRWATLATTGNAQWDFDYRAIADAESFDPTTHQESVNSGAVAVPGTAKNEKETVISLTAANFAADDWVEFILSRDGASANDTAAAALVLLGAQFQYADA